MTRWSLRRHGHRAQRPGHGTVPPRPELGPAPGDFRPDGYAPGGPAGFSAPPGPYPGTRHPGAAPWQGGFPQTEFRQSEFRQSGAGQPSVEDTAVESFPPVPQHAGPGPGLPAAGGAWPEVMERFGLHLLTLAEQLRISLDELEADEADPERLQKLYKVDHAVTRMRRASRDLRTLAGRGEDELSGVDTSLLDVIRVALSAIERYTQVTTGRIADFAVIGYAADDVAALLAALLDNATRYSPGVTAVSAHLTDGGSVLFRIEDGGIGMDPDGVAALNAMLAGDVPELDDRTGRHTGFPVVHRIARKYSIGVRLAARSVPGGGSGTIALVTVPPELLCELPEDALGFPAPPPAREGSVSVLPSLRREPPPAPEELPRPRYGSAAGTPRPRRAGLSRDEGDGLPGSPRHSDARDGGYPGKGADGSPSGLPKREPGSLRGGKPRAGGGADNAPAPERSAEERSAARRAFADDLAAFSLGSADADAPESQDPKGKGTPS